MLPLNTVNIDYIPSHILIHLSGREVNILKKIFFIMKQHAKEASGNLYECICGEEWLAKECETSTWQISRSIQKLTRLGILQVRQRRGPNGEWLTNLYRLGSALFRHIVKILTRRKPKKVNRLQESANIGGSLEEPNLVSKETIHNFVVELTKKIKKVGKGGEKKRLKER